MKDYKIINAGSSSELTQLVQLSFLQGWIAQGGVSFAMNKWGQQYSQAMVKPNVKEIGKTGPM